MSNQSILLFGCIDNPLVLRISVYIHSISSIQIENLPLFGYCYAHCVVRFLFLSTIRLYIFGVLDLHNVSTMLITVLNYFEAHKPNLRSLCTTSSPYHCYASGVLTPSRLPIDKKFFFFLQ